MGIGRIILIAFICVIIFNVVTYIIAVLQDKSGKYHDGCTLPYSQKNYHARTFIKIAVTIDVITILSVIIGGFFLIAVYCSAEVFKIFVDIWKNG